jgi:hypothetical protein
MDIYGSTYKFHDCGASPVIAGSPPSCRDAFVVLPILVKREKEI